jgi:hypothetical protein
MTGLGKFQAAGMRLLSHACITLQQERMTGMTYLLLTAMNVGCSTNKSLKQGCQMVCFQTKNPNFGKFGRVLQWKILVYFMTIWSILRPLEIFYGHLVYFAVIWYIFPVFAFCTKKNLATLV